MVGMETLRCPTCVSLLPDPTARRCPVCHSKLRKRRGGPVVLGESNRLSSRSLPFDVELRARADARFLPDEQKFERIVEEATSAHSISEAALAPAAPAPPVPRALEPVDALYAESFSQPLPEAAEPDYAAAPDIDRTAQAVKPIPEPIASAPVPEPIPEPVAEIDLTTEPEPADEPLVLGDGSLDSPSKSPWQPVPARSASPLDGSLDDIVGELHRRAREDGDHDWR